VMALRNGGLPHFGPERICVIDVPLDAHVTPGKLDPANGRAVLATLDLAVEGIAAGWFAAMVTAPLQKSTINDAGVAFSGHTEYLAEKTATPLVVMMLAGTPAPGQPMLRVALATTHLPLRAVPDAITQDGLARVLDIIDCDLKRKFGIAAPRILVAGLNPHAGENGYLGREEIDTITPALEAARASMPRAARIRPTRCSSRNTWKAPIACWRCTTTRACRCSSTPPSGAASTSRSGCR